MRIQRRFGWVAAVAVLLIAGLGYWAWSGASADEGAPDVHDEPAHVEAIEGTDASRVILSQKAAERLDIQTAPIVDEQAGDTPRRVIPYAAVLYHADGSAFTYTNPEPLVYVQHPITIDRIEGDKAFLTDGPPAGTVVVIVGGAELFGTEYGVGH